TQLDALSRRRRGHDLAFDLDARPRGHVRERALRHRAGLEHDLKVAKAAPVVELHEMEPLAVAARLHPTPRGHAPPRLALQQVADVLARPQHGRATIALLIPGGSGTCI